MEDIRDSLSGFDMLNIMKKIFFYLIVFFCILYFSNMNFLLFHTIIELVCSLIAFIMFTISLNTYDINQDTKIVFLSVAFGFIGCFLLLHVLSFTEIAIIEGNSRNISIQLCIVARYMESLTFLFTYTISHNNHNIKKVILLYFCISFALIVFIFYTSIIPDCYINGLGFTNFKVISEYIICGIFLVTIFYIIKFDNKDRNKKNMLIIYSLISTIMSELILINCDNNEMYMVLGHLIKFISYYFIYTALIKSSLREPHYNLIKLNNLLDCKNRNLQNMITRIRLEFEKRMNLEKENIKKNEILDAILEASINGILVIGNNKKIIHTNNTLFKIFNICDDRNYYENLEQFINVIKNQIINQEMDEFIDKLNGSQINFTFDLHLINGKIIETTSYPLINKGQYLGKVISFRDVTEKNEILELQKQIEINQILLEKTKELDEIKTNFFATISHEFRTPINIILGVIQLFSHINSFNDNNQNNLFNRYIKIVKQNCYRLIKLANNLIDITKIDAGYMKMNLKNYNIVSIVENITLSVVEFVKNKGISLIFDTDEEEIITACDADKLERIMLNLLSNSAKFVDSRGKIEVKISRNEDVVIISVKDDGIGIPANMVETIFDRFQQVDSTLRRRKEGSGIGLSIVKSMVQLHGGSITLNSDIGKGSEFIINLPIKLIDEDVLDYTEYKLTESKVDKINIEFSDIYELNDV